MYLSCLLIDTGMNPDRPRPGRLWLRNRYRVHQRLCMAFPSKPRCERDPEFLTPFWPGDFAANQVHQRRTERLGFLFRIDPAPGGRAVVLVQSGVEPKWSYAFHNAHHLLAASPAMTKYEPAYVPGQRYRFRLVGNPTRRRHQIQEGQPKNRVPVPPSEFLNWLESRADHAGFRLLGEPVMQSGFAYFRKSISPDGVSPDRAGQRLRSVRYDGLLEVVDPSRLLDAVIQGIGPAKAFGFGLLSLVAEHP